MTTQILEAIGLKCPMPIIEISKIMKKLSVGDKLEIHADDPVFVPDLEAWCRKTKNKLESIEEKDGIIKAIVEKTN